MADTSAVYTGTGRRKEATARVRLIPGTGKILVNGRDAGLYFGRHQLLDNALAPFRVTDTVNRFDVVALCDGALMVSLVRFVWVLLVHFLKLASIVQILKKQVCLLVTHVLLSVRNTV